MNEKRINKHLFEVLKTFDGLIPSDTKDLQHYKEQYGQHFISGEILPNEKGKYRNSKTQIKSRDFAVLDYDKVGVNESTFIRLIEDKLKDYTFMIYPTINNQMDKPRYRVLLELERSANEGEYASTVQQITKLIGLPHDPACELITQLQALPMYRNYDEFISKVRINYNKLFPVSEAKVNKVSENINNQNYSITETIKHEVALKYFADYVKRNSARLQDYREALKSIMVLAKAVQTNEIEYDTALECAEVLAGGHSDWEKGNIEKLNNEIQNKYIKTEATFRSCYMSYVLQGKNNRNISIERDINGKYKTTLKNLAKMVNCVVQVLYNDFTKNIEIKEKNRILVVDNEELATIRAMVEEKFYISISKNNIWDVVYLASKEHIYNPVQDIIKKENWDGVKRAETIFIDFLGVEDNIYNREISKKILLASVYRNFQENVKFDEMVVLHGSQGMGKSTILERLAFSKYYLSLTDKIDSKDTNQLTLSKWIVEHEELATIQKTGSNTMKSWLSSHNDTYRLPYARNTKTFPRRFVNFGTTNQDEFLKDQTGNRRYLILECNKDRVKKSIWETDDSYFYQLWAELYQLYLKKESIVISKETTGYMEDKTKGYILKDSITEYLTELLEMLLPEEWSEFLTINSYSTHPNKNELKIYIADMLDRGVSEYFKHDKKKLIQDITTRELIEIIAFHCDISKMTDRQLQGKVSNFFSGLENWKKSYNIIRHKKRSRGYRRK